MCWNWALSPRAPTQCVIYSPCCHPLLVGWCASTCIKVQACKVAVFCLFYACSVTRRCRLSKQCCKRGCNPIGFLQVHWLGPRPGFCICSASDANSVDRFAIPHQSSTLALHTISLHGTPDLSARRDRITAQRRKGQESMPCQNSLKKPKCNIA